MTHENMHVLNYGLNLNLFSFKQYKETIEPLGEIFLRGLEGLLNVENLFFTEIRY